MNTKYKLITNILSSLDRKEVLQLIGEILDKEYNLATASNMVKQDCDSNLNNLMFDNLVYWPKFLTLKLIKLYQKTLSFDHGIFSRLFPDGYCRFHPTCSEYGYQAIKKGGLVVGGLKTIWRILRCNPWNKGGVDEP